MSTENPDGAGEHRPRVERVAVVGTGLVGTSVALALRNRGVDVLLSDPDKASMRMAYDLGAGRPLDDAEEEPPADVAVVAAPPEVVPQVLQELQDRGVAQVYTDVSSVKVQVVEGAEELGCDLATFVPGHPMGGREKHGPGAARADLFLGRAWALCPTGKADPGAIAAVTEIAHLCGADPLVLDAKAHDRAVALVSHAPHVAASTVAARLLNGDEAAMTLAGQGVRDITRVAAGDPHLWTAILSHNATPVAQVLSEMAEELTATAKALRSVGKTGEAALEPVRDLMERGRSGQARIPGKHGAVQRPAYTVLPVVVPDEPGSLGRLFAAAADAGVNIEDVRIEHTPGLPLGVASLFVLPEAEGSLARALSADGWSVHPGR